ncbi:hypothetical protein [Candidatus Nitronereus thalassa]|uniref:Type II secretion system protein GspC N-terminal domain-containing protein n=1 Tax=Candidatus Nitronereus thalassa TaxID=3020898 RepID=A0ABU3K3V4_9BACT|nr:hypothetical protein [Candidatus Nitronereus thalassa]MDT7041068.1 hypothetical protein [Candidatus Nitronereus thalassa]
MTKREKGLLLIGVLLLGATLIIVEDMEQEAQQYAPTNIQATRPASRETGPLGFGVDHTVPITLNTPRNIFAPLKDPNQPKPTVAKTRAKPEATPPKPRAPKAAPVNTPPPPPPPPSPNNLAAQQAQQQLRQYQFLGYLTKKGDQQVFLSNGQAIYIVKQGETLEGDIQVKSIEPTAVVLSKYLKGIGETVEATIPLTKDGNKT